MGGRKHDKAQWAALSVLRKMMKVNEGIKHGHSCKVVEDQLTVSARGVLEFLPAADRAFFMENPKVNKPASLTWETLWYGYRGRLQEIKPEAEPVAVAAGRKICTRRCSTRAVELFGVDQRVAIKARAAYCMGRYKCYRNLTAEKATRRVRSIMFHRLSLDAQMVWRARALKHTTVGKLSRPRDATTGRYASNIDEFDGHEGDGGTGAGTAGTAGIVTPQKRRKIGQKDFGWNQMGMKCFSHPARWVFCEAHPSKII